MTGAGHYQSGVAASMFPFAVCYKYQLPLIAYLVMFIACLLGVTAPDYLEIRRSKRVNYGLFGRKTKTITRTMLTHRGITHTISLWLIATWWFYTQAIQPQVFWPMIGFSFGFAYCYGAVIHLLGDFPNKQGIPFLPFGRKYCLNWWKSSKYEWFANICLACIVLICTLYYLGRSDFLSLSHILN